jgi:hypothetical protein
MQPTAVVELPKGLLTLLNQLYELETKLKRVGDNAAMGRNISKMKDALEEMGLFYEDPMGQPFRETRTDLEATISGTSTEDLIVVEVIKPIVRHGARSYSRVIQKGIVVVESNRK